MEGRTIARPNWRVRRALSGCRRCFNGGPDNCPAKPGRPQRSAQTTTGFNGGPDNCPAKRGDVAAGGVDEHRASMEGRTIARPNQTVDEMVGGQSFRLQWRAGQLPGQTLYTRSAAALHTCFNGGPDNCPAKPRGSPPRQSLNPSFNGGPDNCPAKRRQRQPDEPREHQASMEGRTIARPNRSRRPPTRPDPVASMEGRTIARPNDGAHPAVHEPRPASMEGRTIARPNFRSPGASARLLHSFNGGPDNCPAKPVESVDPSTLIDGLQWRAGQLPGQTLIAATLRLL